MRELFRCNDPVLLSFAASLLAEAGIHFFIADAHMSVLEGSLGVLPRRMLVEAGEFDRARQLLADAGVGPRSAAAEWAQE